MPATSTSDYVYANDDQYCYPGTDVLVNIFGIQDDRQLEEVERELALLRITELLIAMRQGFISNCKRRITFAG